jgi:glycosyltransferase involved in cell wall biosynthesis
MGCLAFQAPGISKVRAMKPQCYDGQMKQSNASEQAIESVTPIFINGRFLTQRTTGVQRYAHALLGALDELLASNPRARRFQFTLLVPPELKALPVLTAIRCERIGRLGGQLWEQFSLPLAARHGLLLNLCNRGPALLQNQLVVIHDAAVVAEPKGYSWAFRVFYRLLFAALRYRGAQIVTVSEFSREELGSRLGFRPERMHVVYPGADHIAEFPPNTSIQRFGLRRGGYAFFVGSPHPNKNLGLVYNAFAKGHPPGFEIAVAGASAPGVFRDGPTSSAPWIRHLGYVSDGELRALYENAGCFVFPSKYEGFGLPPLEAMSLGCPVVASNAAAIPEVCRGAALFFNPDDSQGLRVAVCSVMNDPGLREQLAVRGRQHAATFTWGASAHAMLDVIDTLRGARSAGSAPEPVTQ